MSLRTFHTDKASLLCGFSRDLESRLFVQMPCCKSYKRTACSECAPRCALPNCAPIQMPFLKLSSHIVVCFFFLNCQQIIISISKRKTCPYHMSRKQTPWFRCESFRVELNSVGWGNSCRTGCRQTVLDALDESSRVPCRCIWRQSLCDKLHKCKALIRCAYWCAHPTSSLSWNRKLFTI